MNFERLVGCTTESAENQAWNLFSQELCDEEQQFKIAGVELHDIGNGDDFQRLHQKVKEAGAKLTILIDEFDSVVELDGCGAFPNYLTDSISKSVRVLACGS